MRSLSTKIETGYLLFAVIIVAVAVYSVYNIKQLSQPLYQLLRDRYVNVTAAEKMLTALRQQELLQFQMVEEGPDTTSVRRFNEFKENFIVWKNRAQSSISLPQEPALLDSISLLYSAYSKKSDTLQRMLLDGKTYKELKRYHTGQIVPLVKKLSTLCHELREVNEIAIERTERKADKLSSDATRFIVVFTLLAIVLSVVAGKYLARRIIRPLKETTEKVKQIGRGNWEQKLEIFSNDELEELALEFNRMTARLAEYEKMNVRKILAEKKKAETIVANIPVGILVLDQQDRILLLNEQAEAILGTKGKNVLNHHLPQLAVNTAIRKALGGAQQPAGEEAEQTATFIPVEIKGKTRFYTVRQIPLVTDEQKKIGSVLLFQDVTTFRELDNLRSEFIATISHEIKTPLTSLNMAVDILLREVSGPLNKTQKELLADVRNDVERLKLFVKELLELAKLESGGYPLVYEQIDITELIGQTLQMLHRLAEKKNISFKTEIGKEIPLIYADSRLLKRVMTNLVKNALEHSPDNEQITIHASVDKSDLLCIVADRGSGIPQEAKEVIFDKFVRLDKRGDSVGLGLSIARGIIRRHGGRIWAENNDEKGTRFCFRIPLNPKNANQPNGKKTGSL